MTGQSTDGRLGLIQALLAAAIWGVLPIYFKLLQSVPALEVVAHRIIWTVPLLLVILYFRKNLVGLKEAWADRKIRGYLFLTAIFIAANWLIYVWAVHAGQILAASLAYFISPLLSVFLANIFLKEKLSKMQWAAVGIAAIGVSILAVEAWQTLWISLVLAGSWSLYALIRKVAPVGPAVGLSIETSYLFPIFLVYLLWIGLGGNADPAAAHFGDIVSIDLLLLGGAAMTAAPLLLFSAAVKKMPLSTSGLLLYLAPTLQFLIGVFLYNEPLTTSHIICFVLIWISLAIYSADTFFGNKPKAAAA